MRLSVEEAACQILQTVQRHLPQASVDHESLGGTHYFYIDHAGARFSVRFPEGALQTKQKAELQAAIHEVIEQVIGVSRHSFKAIQIHPDAFVHREQSGDGVPYGRGTDIAGSSSITALRARARRDLSTQRFAVRQSWLQH